MLGARRESLAPKAWVPAAETCAAKSCSVRPATSFPRVAGLLVGGHAHLIADRRQRTWPSPEAHLETVETLRALRSLPGSHRDAVVLAAEGFSLREIADALGISVPAAKKRVSRGRRALRDLLDPPGGRRSDD